MRSVGVVLAVRNEEASLSRVIAALESQTLPPSEVVIVDDGSNDRTNEILKARALTSHLRLTVVALEHHDRSYVGRPELAVVFNAGLRVVRDRSPRPEFVMILGGDHLLPPEYIQKMVGKFDSDRSLAVAGGWIANEPYWEHAPRGSSMMARADFWEEAGRLQFPVDYGWESWLYLKAMQSGRTTRSFKDVPTSVSRRTSATKGLAYGRAMYALGYYPLYALGRCLLVAPRSPRGAVKTFAGYLGHAGLKRLDVADWVRKNQRQVLFRRAFHLLQHLGRR